MLIKTRRSSNLVASQVFLFFNKHKIVGKGWVKWAKILNYFKSSQNASLKFKKIKLVIILLKLFF